MYISTVLYCFYPSNLRIVYILNFSLIIELDKHFLSEFDIDFLNFECNFKHIKLLIIQDKPDKDQSTRCHPDNFTKTEFVN